ncbi:MAG: hydroxyethylthiazole kinase, partial [Candidatus Latescibacteria bacterium]|nr:hydroxyethylthiazole kinase [Candidatus Latescibacterota bacterium]
KGVESTTVEKDIIPLAKKLSRARKATVVITGQEDMITDSENVYVVKNGHEMMGSIVGTGCMAASIIGAFAGVEKNYIKAAVSALVCFGIAGELASITSKGPGSFHVNFYDEVYNLDKEKIERMTNIEERHA